MSAWTSLQSVIERLRPHVSQAQAVSGDLRRQAAALVLSAYGIQGAARTEYVNIAALALLMHPHLVVHRISSGASHLIEDTDLRTLPAEPPHLLRGPCILTSRNPERGECLFGNTAELAMYALDGTIYLIGLHYPDGISVAPWRPHWSQEEVEITTGGTADLIFGDLGAWREWGRQAARFAVILGLLLDAEGTPLLVEGPQKPRAEAKGRHGYSRSASWSVRRVYVDNKGYRPSAPGSGEGESRDISRLQLARVMVTGFLRRQPYGPGGALRKWVYIQSYEARRWVAPDRHVRVDVETRGDA